jgi:hypothetical protein
MKLQPNEIKCPYCHRAIEKDGTDYLICPLCKTTIDLTADGRVLDYKVPEYHEATITILSIISFVLFMGLLADAYFSEKALRKLGTIGIIATAGLYAFLWLPFRMGYSFTYGRFPAIIAMTLVLLLILILHVGNFINY